MTVEAAPVGKAFGVYELLILTVFPFAVIFAASMDLVSYRIPNRISIFLFFAFLALFPFADPTLDRFLGHLAAAAVVFIPTFLLFSVGAFGGGDVKLLTAIALWVGWDQLLGYVLLAGVCGGGLALALLFFRSMPLPLVLAKQPWLLKLYKPGGKVPYGIALSGAALIVYPETIWFLRLVA